MTSPARNKGNAFERLIRDYLRDCGFPAERIPAGMTDDRGDIGGIPGWTLQLKCYPNNVQRAITDGLHDLTVQQANADTAYGAVIVKRRGTTDPGAQLFVCELWNAVPLLRACPVVPRGADVA